jgi:DHA1 family tetracycline resistance protein-like MFS transporter
VGVTSIVVQGGLTGPVVKRLGERQAMMFGLCCGIIGFLIYGFAPTGGWIWLAIPISALWAFYGPAAQSLMSRCVDPSEQGRLQGALASMNGIAFMIAPVLYPQLFAAALDMKDTTGALPVLGAPFFMAAGLLSVALMLAERATRRPSAG